MLLPTLLAAPLMFATVPPPPKTKTDPVTEQVQSVSITDPYRWLEDQNSPATRAWIDEQVKYTESLLGQVPQRAEIKKILAGVMKIDIAGIPVERRGRYFYTKRSASQNQPVLYMRKSRDAAEEVLLDGNQLSADQTVSANFATISKDGRLVAYAIRAGGEDEVSIRFVDLDSGKEVDKMPRARYAGLELSPDKKTLYYGKFLPEGVRIYSHAMGSDLSKDQEIFGKDYGPEYGTGCQLSEDGRYLLCHVSHGAGGSRSELWLKDLSAGSPFKPIAKGIDASFRPEMAGDHLYILTDWKAPNFRVVMTSLSNPSLENTLEVVPERKYRLENLSAVGGRLFVNYLENVHSKIEMLDATGKLIREIELPGLGTAGGPFGRWETSDAFYTYSSFAQPGTIYRYNVSTGKQEVYFQAKAAVDPATIEVKQIWYESKDKTRVPMFIVHRKGLKLDGTAPALLTGYGGFDIASLPSFSPVAAAWTQLGGVYALANLRGGGEFGKAWHEAGMKEKKQNVFDDFIAAGEYLVANHYTSKARLAIRGGSNGGLLVGAALTQRPDLFGAALCAVPLLDMVRYQKFKIAKLWVPEYGSSEDPKQFEYIFKYSPYHHVEKGVKYPAVMFITGDSDTRVDPLHARKMAALMQSATGSGKPVLLHYDTKGGHSNGLPVDRQIDNLADELAFLVWQFGM